MQGRVAWWVAGGAAAAVALVALGKARRASIDEAPPATTASLDGGGVGEPGVQPLLAFHVDAVHARERPSTRAPWHEAGGEWTFFDATTASGVHFGFGFPPPDPNGQPFTFGHGMLTVPDADDGARFVEMMAKALGGKVPSARVRTPLAITPVGLAFLGVDAHHEGAGFGGRGGGWYATKLFLQRAGAPEAELFFNFNLAEKTGHFAVKDDDYADAAVAFFAAELRDGPRPRRTAATEPSMSATGPHIEWLRRLEGDEPILTSKRDAVVVWRASATSNTAVIVASALEDGKETELTKVEAARGSAAWANGWGVVIEARGDARRDRADDAVRVLVVGGGGAPRDISASVGGHVVLEPRATPPDGSVVVLVGELPGGDPKNRHRAMFVVDAGARVRGPVDLGEQWTQIVGFEEGAAVVRRSDLGKVDGTATYATVDLTTLALRPIEPPRWARRGASPDGARVAGCVGGEIAVATDRGATLRFRVFDEDKARYEDGPDCVDWVSSRALAYRGVTNGLLDADTMKLTALADDEGELGAIVDVAPPYVVVRDKSVRVGRVVDGP